MVDVESSIDLSTLTCSAATALEKFDPASNAWTALHDDRYAWNQNPGYYLDDTFVPSMFNLGCDVVFCTPLPGSREHVLVEAASLRRRLVPDAVPRLSRALRPRGA